MTEGRLYTENGAIECPDVTIVAATTDAGVLPNTFLSRFMIKPRLVPYTAAEATQIVTNLALRMNVETPDDVAPVIAQASSGNPRDMRSILTAVRDLQFGFPDCELDIDKALQWAGFTRDGLSQLALEMLLVLSQQTNRTASIDTLQAILNEPGPLRHEEQTLLQRGYVTISGRGRQLTDSGLTRVQALAFEGR
jgi:Holliday junction resolvasome RuvABC ATP-dependent DNA helicase subunit